MDDGREEAVSCKPIPNRESGKQQAGRDPAEYPSDSFKENGTTSFLGFLGLLLLFSTCSGARHAASEPQSNHARSVVPESRNQPFYYSLDVRVDPSRKEVSGHVVWGMRHQEGQTRLTIDLEEPLRIHRVRWGRSARSDSMVQIQGPDRVDERYLHLTLPASLRPGERYFLELSYEGSPRAAETPPWDGGMVWSESEEGAPWIGVTAQMSGASVWWPSANDPSSRPDSMDLAWTLPDSLEVASNGRLIGTERAEPGWKRWSWRVGHPISPYQVTMNAGPFDHDRFTYLSSSGNELDLQFWILPERSSSRDWLVGELIRQLDFFEGLLGPYPFQDEKLGVAHTSYLGMEHQTILSYGSSFEPDGLFRANLGFDDLLHHELAHEWWGNLVTVSDWRHFWLHEGFATYMQALYAETLGGDRAYRRMMRRIRPLIRSRVPLVPEERSTPEEMARDGRSVDVYYKGAWILHTLREWVGSERWDPLLKRFLWEGPGSRSAGTPPSRSIDSEMWISFLEEQLPEPVRPVLEHYLYSVSLPRIHVESMDQGLRLRWSHPEFDPLPVPVRLNGEWKELYLRGDGTILPDVKRDQLELDPAGSILMAEPDG